MSNFEDGSYSSLTGIDLLGKVLAGRCQMHYTRAAVGKGAIPEGKTPKTMDVPPEYVMDARIASVTNPVGGECQVTVQIRSDDVETGFYVTSIVLYAEDPDLGEVPYTYLSLENEPEWIRPASSVVGKFATFYLIAVVGDVDTVAAFIDPEAIATVGDVLEVKEHLEKNSGFTEYSMDSSYLVGNYCLYQNTLYKCVQETTGEWNPACWKQTDTLSEIDELKNQTEHLAENQMAITYEPDEKTLTFFSGISGSGAEGSGGYTLPVASETQLGGVRIGSGIDIDNSGTISIDAAEAVRNAAASDVETSEMLTEVFGS